MAGNKQKKFYGFIARKRSGPSETVIAIRGTRGLQEWLIDFEGLPAPFPGLPDAHLKVESGFLSVFKSLRAVTPAGAVTQVAEHTGFF